MVRRAVQNSIPSIVIILWALAACTEDMAKVTPPPSTRTSTGAVRASSSALVPAGDAGPSDQPLPETRASACLPSGPAACHAEGAVWVTAEVAGRSDNSAVRSAAAQRALDMLEAVPDAPPESLASREVVRVARCGKGTIALARAPWEESGLSPCSPKLTKLAERRRQRRCPAWAEAYAYWDGTTLIGVGQAKGIKNRALARSTALNRARGHAAAVLGDGIATLRESESKVAICSGRIVARVAYARSE